MNPTDIAYVLAAVLAAAIGGGATAWRRLTILGKAERGKLEAEKQDILSQAEDRATSRSLQALQQALAVVVKEREYLATQLTDTRATLAIAQHQISILAKRIAQLEDLAQQHSTQLTYEVSEIKRDLAENYQGPTGPQGEKGERGEKGEKGSP